METIAIEVPHYAGGARAVLDRINDDFDVYRESGYTGPVMSITVLPGLEADAQYFQDLLFMKLVVNLVNKEDGFIPDYENTRQEKWTPRMVYSPGAGFRLYGCRCANAASYLSARLAMATEARATEVYNKFPERCNRIASYNSVQMKEYYPLKK